MTVPSLSGTPSDVPVKPAATVLLVRDGDAGLEVFMLRRTFSAAFASGMFVFPGGKVDEVDASSEIGDICEGLTDAEFIAAHTSGFNELRAQLAEFTPGAVAAA